MYFLSEPIGYRFFEITFLILTSGSSRTYAVFSSVLLHGLGTALVWRRYGVNPE